MIRDVGVLVEFVRLTKSNLNEGLLGLKLDLTYLVMALFSVQVNCE